ncbi:MAG: hypothetical protein HY246_07860 [Proteobacteria bacterium]|nr:hypothetical protein [Pseudomonadota bacterium]
MSKLGQPASRRGPRILIYSHDTMGLGHLRRCRTIAHALVERDQSLSVLILSGSPIIGSIDIQQTLDIRASIIRHTAEAFQPDLFLVDKEPLGLRGEVADTLAMLKSKGVPLVLGLRDVMDDPALLDPEWKRKNAMPALRDLYDDIWVYGLPQICDPLNGLAVPKSVKRKISYTGYLHRALPPAPPPSKHAHLVTGPYILVTTGGGGDGEALIDWTLRAYEYDANLPHRALLVLGPFMHSERQAEFLQRAARLPAVEAITFDAHLEPLMAGAAGVVAMGGLENVNRLVGRWLTVPVEAPRKLAIVPAE